MGNKKNKRARLKMKANEKQTELVQAITNDTVVDASNIDAFFRKIQDTLPDETIERRENGYIIGSYDVNFVERRRVMSLLFGDTWEHVLKYIAQDESHVVEKFCPVCMEGYDTGFAVTCHECRKSVCPECNVIMFVKNEGLMICVHCRNVVGQKLHPYICAMEAAKMMLKYTTMRQQRQKRRQQQ
jgi:hypothetical protein